MEEHEVSAVKRTKSKILKRIENGFRILPHFRDFIISTHSLHNSMGNLLYYFISSKTIYLRRKLEWSDYFNSNWIASPRSDHCYRRRLIKRTALCNKARKPSGNLALCFMCSISDKTRILQFLRLAHRPSTLFPRLPKLELLTLQS